MHSKRQGSRNEPDASPSGRTCSTANVSISLPVKETRHRRLNNACADDATGLNTRLYRARVGGDESTGRRTKGYTSRKSRASHQQTSLFNRAAFAGCHLRWLTGPRTGRYVTRRDAAYSRRAIRARYGRVVGVVTASLYERLDFYASHMKTRADVPLIRRCFRVGRRCIGPLVKPISRWAI